MASTARFEDEDGDIVRLINPESPDTVRGGWVNVGPHAIRIEFNPQTGDLDISTFPREQEFDALGRLTVKGQLVRANGGVDADRSTSDSA